MRGTVCLTILLTYASYLSLSLVSMWACVLLLFRLLARLLVSLFARIVLLLMLHLAVHHWRCYALLMLININAAAHAQAVG